MAKSLNMEVVLDLSSYNVVEAKLSDFVEIVSKYKSADYESRLHHSVHTVCNQE
jgi:hypothetical protein